METLLFFLGEYLERGVRMVSKHFSGAELVKKNGHLAYTSTKRDGSKLEVYLIHGKATKMAYMHVFLSDKYRQEHYANSSNLESILADSMFAEYSDALVDVWNKRMDILSNKNQKPIV